MAIKQTAISYYGLNYVEHAERDFEEMKAHGCTTVILAVTEFDFNFWRPNIPKIVDAAHKLGLRVLLDPWGIGKYFGGEQVSKYLQNNIENRQVSALTGEGLDALKEAIAATLLGDAAGTELWITQERHVAALSAVEGHLERALGLAASGELDLVSLELQDALTALGQMTGRHHVAEEALASIFAAFCVGK